MLIPSELRAGYRFPTAVETDEVLPIDGSEWVTCLAPPAAISLPDDRVPADGDF
jgi:hypothetical protein